MRFLKYLILIIFISCSTVSDDPLKNTKKLIKSGHSNLYNNGAFKVPMTSIKLIPPGPDSLALASTMFGIKARESLLLSLKNASESFYIVKSGVLKTLDFSGTIYGEAEDLVKIIHTSVKKDSYYIISKSIELPKKVFKKSIKLKRRVVNEIKEFSNKIDEGTKKFGNQIVDEYVYGGYITSIKINMESEKRKAIFLNEAEYTDSYIASVGKDYDEVASKKNKNLAANMEASGKRADKAFQNLGDQTGEMGKKIGKGTYKIAKDGAEAMNKSLSGGGDRVGPKLFAAAKFFNEKSKEKAARHLEYAKDNFIQGYIVLPKKLKNRGLSVAKSFDEYSKSFSYSSKLRKELSDKMSYIFTNTLSTYGDDFSASLNQAKKEVTQNSQAIGYTFGAIKSLYWVTKAIFWDSIIKPVGKATAAGLGYITTNAVIYPTMLVTAGGIATTQVAVKIVANTGMATYDLVAPTATSAIAAVFSLLEYTGGKIGTGVLASTALPAKYILKGAGKVSSSLVKTVGKSAEIVARGSSQFIKASAYGAGKFILGTTYLGTPIVKTGLALSGKIARGTTWTAGKISGGVIAGVAHVDRAVSISGSKIIQGGTWATGHLIEVSSKAAGKVAATGTKYIGVPLATVGIPIAATSVGVAVGAAGVAAGSSYFVTGESVGLGIFGFGTTLAGVTTAGGTAGSVAVGSIVGIYELGKSVTVPSGYILGSGIVLSYGSLVHLGAQTVLAAADVAYLVLSLEGPRWVIYGVKGKLGKGNDLVGGTILDLEEMKKGGEKFEYIPASKDEIKKIIKSIKQYD